MSAHRISGYFALALLPLLSACAMHQAATQPSADTAAPAMTPAGPMQIDAASKSEVTAAMPKTVVVTGVVDTVQATESRITINFKNTQDSQFYAVVLYGTGPFNQAFGGDISKAITGKTVHLTGVIVLYRDKPEMVLSTPDELKVDAGQ